MSDASHPPYIANVDGLRAIAVLSVVAFHAMPEWITGGFVGVDIFFVISGFLISGIILRGLERGTFSLADFYGRRVRRILPALVLVLAVTFVLGWLLLFASEFRNLGKHMASGALFVSNIALWLDTGYFDTAAEQKPLLHLWSLAVEEQFYFVWPLFLYFAYRHGWRTRTAIAVVLLASFALNVAGTSIKPIATFFLPVTRFWELMIGSALAYFSLKGLLPAWPDGRPRHITFSPLIRNVAAWAGLAMIAVAVLLLDRSSIFPGWLALLPTVGAALLIAAGPLAWPNRVLLASRPMVFVGLISYPLYLWHWPLLAYARIVTGHALPLPLAGGLVALAMGLAWATYRWVETPIRFGLRNARWPVPALCGALTGLAAIGIAANLHALRSRLDNPITARIDAALSDWHYPGGNFKKADGFSQTRLAGERPAAALFIGDSHMEQYWARAQARLADGGNGARAAVFLTSAGCPPVPDTNRLEPGFACQRFYEHAIGQAARPEFDVVVLAAAWEAYFPQAPSGPGSRNPSYQVSSSSRAALTADDPAADQIFATLQRDIAALRAAGKRVYLVLPNPTSPSFNPLAMQPDRLGAGDRLPAPAPVSRPAFAEEVAPVVKRLRAVADATGAVLVDPADSFCDAALCPTVTDDGQPIYTDSNHVRASYARVKARFIDRMLTAD